MKREDARSQKPSNKSTSRIRRASARLAADASRAFQPVVSIAPTAAVTGSDIVNKILVFWNGSENNPAVLAAWKDTNYLQGDGGGQWAYSRRIEPMGMADIVRYHDPDHLGIPLPPIDHQGINDQDNGKAWFASEASE